MNSNAGRAAELILREETPRGHGAVSVVSVRGERACQRLRDALGWRVLDVGVPRVGRLRLGDVERRDVRDDTGDLDEAIVCARSPVEVELHLHGSPVLVRELILGLQRRLGARVVGAGEFGANVFDAGEFEGTSTLAGAGGAGHSPDARAAGVATPARASRPAASAAARAWASLQHAPSESGARILLDQAEGAWGVALERIARGTMADVEFAALVERSRVARFALEPARVVLAGAVNAGKSTLFNALLGERRAITSDEPGTTRDLVRASALLGAYPVELIDTAGERASGLDLAVHEIGARGIDPHGVDVDEIEAAGIARARATRDTADLVLWLVDAASGEPHDARDPAAASTSGAVRIRSRADLGPVAAGDEPATSALHAPESARALVARLHRERFGLPLEPWTPGVAAAFDSPSRDLLARLAAAPTALARSERAAAALRDGE